MAPVVFPTSQNSRLITYRNTPLHQTTQSSIVRNILAFYCITDDESKESEVSFGAGEDESSAIKSEKRPK